MERLYSNYSLKNHNSFGVNVNAQFFYEFSEIVEIEKFAKEKLNDYKTFRIIGFGNNILLKNDIDGVVIKSTGTKIDILNKSNNTITIRAEAGIDWDWFVEYTMKQKWYGLENLSSIPGSVGAAPIQNIGAYGVEIEQFIESIEVIDLLTTKIYNIVHNKCDFGYRYSILKKPENMHLLILSVNFKLLLNFKPNLSYKALSDFFDNTNETTPQKIRQKVIDIRNSKLPDPKIIGNAGSFFKNPVVNNVVSSQLIELYPNIPHWKVSHNETKFSAAWFIEQCGLKGYISESGAGTHTHQPLVLVNHGNAKGIDILNLAKKIISEVNNKFNIELEPEVNIW